MEVRDFPWARWLLDRARGTRVWKLERALAHAREADSYQYGLSQMASPALAPVTDARHALGRGALGRQPCN